MNEQCRNIRKSVLEMMNRTYSSHIGSCFSIVEILYVLFFKYFKDDDLTFNLPDRNKFILSKAHASAALYATFAERGIIEKGLLNTYYVDGGELPGHLDDNCYGVEVSTGSLGHGLSIGCGMAIAHRNRGYDGRIFVLMGDGECNEGSVWEATMLISSLNLDNITLIIDNNQLQGYGRNVLNQNNLHERFSAFGFEVVSINGHNIDELTTALSMEKEKPICIIANTIKGYGVSFMEDKLEWHYKSPNDEQLGVALKEIGF